MEKIMKSFMAIVFALGTIAAITGSASAAENDNDRDTHNVKQFYQKLDMERQ